jgi:RNA polymerase sigma-70 factor (ECF subfamily)
MFSFVASRLREDGDNREVFSMFMEDFWRGLPRFSGRCSMRTWCYKLAQNAVARYARAPRRMATRNIPLSLAGVIERGIRTGADRDTPPPKDRCKKPLSRTGGRLTPDEQTLLVLRVDRNMSWRDLAIATSGEAECNDDTIAREAARLRKVFERIKQTLRKLAEAEGLLKTKRLNACGLLRCPRRRHTIVTVSKSNADAQSATRLPIHPAYRHLSGTHPLAFPGGADEVGLHPRPNLASPSSYSW